MSFKLGERVFETSSTSGTGAYVLLGAVSQYRAFSAELANGDTVFYEAWDGTDYEAGLGTYVSASNSLSRTTIYDSTNGGLAVNWGPGTRNILLTLPSKTVESLLDPAQASGLVCRTSTHVYAGRQIVSSTPALGITNPAGVAGNPTLTISLGNGIKDTASTLVAAVPVSTITGSLTVSAGHRATLLDIASAVAIAISSAGVLGADHFFMLHNSAASAIVVSAANQIDGASSVTVEPGTGTVFVCNGSTFRTVGGSAPKVKASSTDSTAGYLGDKLSAGTGITFSTVNSGGNMAVQINAQSGSLVSVQVFTAASTNWNRTSGATRARILCVGGGGGGGGSKNSGGGSSGGGGGGGYAEKVLDITSIASAVVSVGTAGTGGTSAPGTGGNGGDTAFGVHCIGKGGTGGGSTGGSGAGGVAGTGDITVVGQAGRNGSNTAATTHVLSGAGGNSALGFGYGGVPATGPDTNGNAATGYGGGGSGGVDLDNGGQTGGAGTAGICIVYEFK